MLAELEAAYLRRLRFEAQVMASAFLGPMTGGRPAAGGASPAGGMVVGASGKRYQYVSPGALLGRIGGR